MQELTTRGVAQVSAGAADQLQRDFDEATSGANMRATVISSASAAG